jgi:hypothetical protein
MFMIIQSRGVSYQGLGEDNLTDHVWRLIMTRYIYPPVPEGLGDDHARLLASTRLCCFLHDEHISWRDVRNLEREKR